VEKMRKRGSFKKLIFTLFVVVASLAVLEMTSRLGYTPKKITYDGLFEYDKDKMFRLKKNTWGGMASKAVATNSLGMRDSDLAKSKQENEKRILVIGDSVSFGLGVEGKDSFPEKLQNILNERQDGRHYEVINAGVPGYSPIQEFYDLKRCLPLQIDALIIQFTINDITDPYVQFRKFGGEGNINGVRDVGRIQYLLMQHSALFLLAQDLISKIKMTRIAGDDSKKKLQNREIYSAQSVVDKPDLPQIIKAWQICKYWLQEIINLAKDNQIPIVLMVCPYDFQLSLPSEKAVPQVKLKEFCKINDIDCVDMLEHLKAKFAASAEIPQDQQLVQIPDAIIQRRVEEHPESAGNFWRSFFLDYDHFNETGNEFAAGILMPALLKLIR
jgi:lysophospholipase L1-like esterase